MIQATNSTYFWGVFIGALIGALAPSDRAHGATITLRDGRVLQGQINTISGVAEDLLRPRVDPGGVDVAPILVLEDGLRRVYVPRIRVVNLDPVDAAEVAITVEQNVAEAGGRIGSVGPILGISEWDEYGRRIFAMNTSDGPVEVIQGITEITPVYTKVEGLSGPRRAIIWDMRIATSSIEQEKLDAILHHAAPQDDPQARLAVVRLYLQGERYRDARNELQKVLADFPDLEGLDAQLLELQQLSARRALAEIALRMEAGQHVFVQNLLANFPAEEVAGETLQQVRENLADYDERGRKLARVKELLDKTIAGLPDATRKQAAPIAEEIAAQLNYNNLVRMAAFLQLGEDPDLQPDEKTALAISSWLLGANNAIRNLPVTLSLVDLRELVREYLREPTVTRRTELLDKIKRTEGATVETTAKMLGLMNPPLEPPDRVEDSVYGLFEQFIPGLQDHADVRYRIQLPPEYDPTRRYPMIVTLSGAGSTPEMQLDFWAGGIRWNGDGDAKTGERVGQAMRHGYITVAIDWRKPHQYEYEFSAREHHAVLSVLRDVARRFSVDLDRVFLTGHDIGGDAAWDIGLAHPDIWAGVIPIVAVADQYTDHYWPNAEYVPFYVVGGELDGKKLKENSRSLDRYLRGHFDATVVEYLGRGHEAFNDEIQHLFDWMNRRKRNFHPKEFECATMRRWDNFFWWVEVDEMPEKLVVEPAEWPPKRNTRALKIRADVTETNGVVVRSGSDKAVIWLSPELIDFSKRITVTVDNRRAAGRMGDIQPSLDVLLEDARARADRQHPFWARIDVP